jgi:hypothetical protein
MINVISDTSCLSVVWPLRAELNLLIWVSPLLLILLLQRKQKKVLFSFSLHAKTERAAFIKISFFRDLKSRRRWRFDEWCKNHPGRQTWFVFIIQDPPWLSDAYKKGGKSICLLELNAWFSSLMLLNIFISFSNYVRTTRDEAYDDISNNIHSCVSNETGVITGLFFDITLESEASFSWSVESALERKRERERR